MIKRFLPLIIILFTWACANRIQPTGGPKDEKPPVLLGSIPKNGQRNFKDTEIQLLFNEFITVKGIKEQLIITPRLDIEYSYKIKRQTLHLEFEESLPDSTTYTLNFRDGVTDIHEGLAAENLQLAFSTGNQLDTLEITGNVINLLTTQPIKDATVGLYKLIDTLTIFTGAPYYFTKTDDQGNYRFKNIKDGEYRIYAFYDSNKNLTCQSDREGYGFLSETLKLDTALSADTISLYNINIDTLSLLRTRPSGKYFNVIASKYLVDAQLKAENDSLLRYHFSDDHKGLVVYNTFSIQDSLMIFTTLKDSLNTIAQDTFYLSFPETTRRPAEFKITASDITASLSTNTITGHINTTKPINRFSTDSAYIEYDTLVKYPVHDIISYKIDSLENTLAYTIPLPKAIADSIKTKWDIARETKSRSTGVYNLNFPRSTIISIEKDTTEAITKRINFSDPTKTGTINGQVNTAYPSYAIQLLDNKYELVAEQWNMKRYNFQHIKPGEYFIRILIDTNENNRWDFFDIRTNTDAEPLILYKDASGNSKTSVRANWELSVDLTF